MRRMGLSNVDTMEIGFRYPLPPCGWLITMNEEMMSKAVSIVMFVTLAVLRMREVVNVVAVSRPWFLQLLLEAMEV
jgi:hypothetical protein